MFLFFLFEDRGMQEYSVLIPCATFCVTSCATMRSLCSRFILTDFSATHGMSIVYRHYMSWDSGLLWCTWGALNPVMPSVTMKGFCFINFYYLQQLSAMKCAACSDDGISATPRCATRSGAHWMRPEWPYNLLSCQESISYSLRASWNN